MSNFVKVLLSILCCSITVVGTIVLNAVGVDLNPYVALMLFIPVVIGLPWIWGRGKKNFEDEVTSTSARKRYKRY
jgi:hypothetical protein